MGHIQTVVEPNHIPTGGFQTYGNSIVLSIMDLTAQQYPVPQDHVSGWRVTRLLTLKVSGTARLVLPQGTAALPGL